MTEIPLELMTSGQRQERIAELRRSLSRAWIKAMIVESVGIVLPVVVVLVLYIDDRISQGTLAPILIALGGLMAAFWVVFSLKVVQPLQREITELEQLDSAVE